MPVFMTRLSRTLGPMRFWVGQHFQSHCVPAGPATAFSHLFNLRKWWPLALICLTKCQASHILLYKKRNPNAGWCPLFNFYSSLCQNLPLRFPASILNCTWNFVSNQITRSQMGIPWAPRRNNGSENFKLYSINIPQVFKITNGVILLLWKGSIIPCFISSHTKISPGPPLRQVATDFFLVNILIPG